LNKYRYSYGYLIDENDAFLINAPISTLYKDDVIGYLKSRNGKPLTQSETKSSLLNISRENRSYPLKSEEAIDEKEWIY
jgi:hypothetical protein